MADGLVRALGYFVFVTGFALVVTGGLALFATWLRPSLLKSRILGPRVLGRFPGTKRNLTLVAGWFVAWGLYLALAALSVGDFELVLLVVALAFAIPAVRILHSGRGA